MLIWDRKKKKKDKKTNTVRFSRKVVLVLSALIIISTLFGAVIITKPEPTYADDLCIPCEGCRPDDLILTPIGLIVLNWVWEPILKDDITHIINLEYEFLNDTFFKEFWIKALAELTNYLSAYGIYQVEMVGSFFDARNQLEASRTIFRLQAEAHRDYQVSDDFCWIGTNVKSLAASESRARLNMLALSKYNLDRQLGKQGSSSAHDGIGDDTGRWHQFVDTFCDEKDNGWDKPGTGLERACDHDGKGTGTVLGANDRSRVNTDIDYTRLIEIPRTLDVNFTDTTTPTPDEESILALSSNLYGSMVPSRTIKHKRMEEYSAAQSLYLDQRVVAAKRSVAQNSFNAIVALKSAGTGGTTPGGPDTATYMAAILQEIMPSGTTDAEIFEILGENPSYYAQLEILSKKMYENPKFFARLYDTPANIARKSVAMKAIELMLDRALFESELRQEMLLSVMISSDMDRDFRRINKNMTEGKN